MTPSDLFMRYNRDYFGGQLPHYHVRRIPLRAFKGNHDEATRTIWIARGLREDDLGAVLLHEMCHIVCGPGHGRRFWRELRRLDRLGEPLPLLDQELAREEERRWKRKLPRMIERLSRGIKDEEWGEWDAYCGAVSQDCARMEVRAGE